MINSENLGFAAGNNSGLAVATGTYVAFVNNDTVLPAGWDVSLTEILDTQLQTGMVLPAVTAAGNPVTVRNEPGETVETLLPFGEFPSGVVVMLRRSQLEALGGWNEEYERASGEDLDLAFTVWAHGLDVVVDSRVLVEHASQASMKEVPGLAALYRKNLERFLDRWDAGPDGPMLDTVGREDYLRNLARARTAVAWIRRMVAARDEAATLRQGGGERLDQVLAQTQVLSSTTSSPIDSRQWGSGSSPISSSRSDARTEYDRPAGRGRVVPGLTRRDPGGVEIGEPNTGPGQLVPRGLPLVGEVEQAGCSRLQRGVAGPGEIGSHRGVAPLVVHHPQLLLLHLPEDGGDEVGVAARDHP